MGRLPRKLLGDGIYHVYNHSANNLWILNSPQCRDRFLEMLTEYAGKYKLNIYHYCIMANHFHLAVEGGITDISSLISGLCSRYSRYYHLSSGKGSGPVWQGRYKSVIVQKADYLQRLGRYIELNPVRADVVSLDAVADYRWSSACCYLTDFTSVLVDPCRHPFFGGENYGPDACRLYRDYLRMPDKDDVALFRSNASRVGDENFLSRLTVVGGRLKLRPGRPKGKKE